jgi:hypothetical protein
LDPGGHKNFLGAPQWQSGKNVDVSFLRPFFLLLPPIFFPPTQPAGGAVRGVLGAPFLLARAPGGTIRSLSRRRQPQSSGADAAAKNSARRKIFCTSNFRKFRSALVRARGCTAVLCQTVVCCLGPGAVEFRRRVELNLRDLL